MRRIGSIILTGVLWAALLGAGAALFAGGMGGGGADDYVPQVILKSPVTEMLDLRGQESVTFTWSTAQRPSYGRELFQFRLFKSRELLADNIMISEDLPSNVKKFTVKADLFENGKTYVWSVRQKSRRGNWSGHSYQSFEVVK